MNLQGSKIVAEYARRTRESAKLAAAARESFPSGVTHDSRHQMPYPIYVERADGSRKWDVDGNQYVDYTGGHGALLLGHNRPEVIEAVRKQLELGTHFGACHRLELEWAARIQKLMPAAQRIRFTNSGTEATLLAVRLARAFTGRTKLIRFLGHFHGWQDYAAFGVASHHDGTPTPGVLKELAASVVLLPPGDIDAVRHVLAERNDVAGVILEPTGATWGRVPLAASFLSDLRELTAATGAVLIFDEVVTGFRCSPGGAQEHFGVRPDLTTLAKILAGGLPGGAIAGRKEILARLAFDSNAGAAEKVAHQGTYNANPISAAAGVAALGIVGSTDACQRANDYAARLREALDRALVEEGVRWTVYGTFSGFHIRPVDPDELGASAEDLQAGRCDYRKFLGPISNTLTTKLRLGMLVHGVDLFSWPGGPTSAVHDESDLEATVEAFRRTLRMLKDEGDI